MNQTKHCVTCNAEFVTDETDPRAHCIECTIASRVNKACEKVRPPYDKEKASQFVLNVALTPDRGGRSESDRITEGSLIRGRSE